MKEDEEAQQGSAGGDRQQTNFILVCAVQK